MQGQRTAELGFGYEQVPKPFGYHLPKGSNKLQATYQQAGIPAG